MPVELDSARREWEHGYLRVQEESRDPATRARLDRQVEVVIEELRRRVGATFTLAQLADAYDDAERWSREAIAEHAATPGWPGTVSLAQAAAFRLYARGAIDYTP